MLRNHAREDSGPTVFIGLKLDLRLANRTNVVLLYRSRDSLTAAVPKPGRFVAF